VKEEGNGTIYYKEANVLLGESLKKVLRVIEAFMSINSPSFS
jgi:hypothetical protein